ncbi:ABC transporter permease subunit [Enterococcus sp. DIV0876]|uniref:ABC transporter permease subunit n=1 Tax=Enterococcus sp. DIV0876 TaxID=2774633 RepID=UPI003D2FC3B7
MSIEPDTFIQGGNPTWIPIAAALSFAIFLPFAGFAYVRGMVHLDRHTGTMELLLASGVGRFRYVFGKLLAGFILLLILLTIVMCGSLFTMLFRFHGELIDLWTFVSPFIPLVPGLLLVTAFSLVLETAPIFRSRNSNALATFLFMLFFLFSLSHSMNMLNDGVLTPRITFDFTGFALLDLVVAAAVFTASGKSDFAMTVFGGGHFSYTGTQQLYFTGIPKEADVLISMTLVVGAALLLTMIAALLLEKRPVIIKQKKKLQIPHRPSKASPISESWQPVAEGRFSLLIMTKNELQRITDDLSFWWYLVVFGLWLASWIVANEISRTILLPLLFGVAVLPLSRLGSEEALTGMDKWLLTIPGAPLRQALASAGSSLLLCLFLLFPALIRSLAIGFPAAMVIFSWGLAIPITALLLGSYTKTERFFQLLLFLFLYVALNFPDLLLPTGGKSAIAVTVFYLTLAGTAILGISAQKTKQML